MLRIQNDDNTEALLNHHESDGSSETWHILGWLSNTAKNTQFMVPDFGQNFVFFGVMFGNGPEVMSTKMWPNASGESPVKSRLHGRCRKNEMCLSRPKQLALFLCHAFFHTKKTYNSNFVGLQKTYQKMITQLMVAPSTFMGVDLIDLIVFFFQSDMFDANDWLSAYAHQLPVSLTLSKALLQGGQIVS